MKNLKKLSRRGILGILALSLTVASVFGMIIAIQNFAPQVISNPAGLTISCLTVTDAVSSNSSTGGHQLWTLTYTCGGGPITTNAQSVLTVTSGSYIPTYTIDTSGSTATITSVSLTLIGNSVQGGTLFCNANIPTYTLTSGTAIALSNPAGCNNGGSNATVSIYYYSLAIVVSTFGTISVGGFSVTWTNA